jgi:hypothetical protein
MASERSSRRRRRGTRAKVVAGRNAVDTDASQAVPPPLSLPRARIERAGLAIGKLQLITTLDEG